MDTTTEKPDRPRGVCSTCFHAGSLYCAPTLSHTDPPPGFECATICPRCKNEGEKVEECDYCECGGDTLEQFWDGEYELKCASDYVAMALEGNEPECRLKQALQCLEASAKKRDEARDKAGRTEERLREKIEKLRVDNETLSSAVSSAWSELGDHPEGCALGESIRLKLLTVDAWAEAIERERDALAAERDQLRAELPVRVHLDEDSEQLADLLEERDQLRAERDQLRAERDQLRAERDQARETNRALHRRVQRAEADAEERTKKKLNWERVSFVLSCFDYVEAQLRDAQALRFPMSWHGHALLAVLRSQIVEAQEFLAGEAWIGENFELNEWFKRTSRELLPLDPPPANKVCELLREAVNLIQLELYHHPNQVRQDQARSLIKRTWDLIEAENLRHLMSDLLPEGAADGN